MFVREKRRTLRQHGPTSYFYLVQAYRNEQGKPRQRQTYLTRISDKWRTAPMHQWEFWATVERALRDHPEREALVAKLPVPRPDRTEVLSIRKITDAQRAGYLALAAAHGNPEAVARHAEQWAAYKQWRESMDPLVFRDEPALQPVHEGA